MTPAELRRLADEFVLVGGLDDVINAIRQAAGALETLTRERDEALSDLELTRHVATHHATSSKKDGGMALNFCPFCGFDFSKRTDWPEFDDE